ncbi:MAG: hypothetical protein PVI52_01310 [Chromatiales bacterium]
MLSNQTVRLGLKELMALLFCVVLGFANTAMAEQGSGFSLTPFSSVAVIGPIDDPVAANETAKAVATALATYVATVDDTQEPTSFPENWVLGGLEGEATAESIEAAILRIPTPYVIDPDEPMSASNRKKVNVVEMCNPLFAKKALGVLPVVDGDDSTKIVNGYIHATALPCEVAIYADEAGYIKVEMLNPEAIFTLFFTDVLFGDQMLDPVFADAIQELPVVVNGEIKTIIYLALDQGGFAYDEKSMPLGLKYHSLEQVAETVANTPYQSPYVHFTYKKRRGGDFTSDEVSTIAASIINILSLDGVHDRRLDRWLNMDDWRSARPSALPVPGNLVIEACSPTNAIAAMGLGLHHATALPCEISVKAVNLDGEGGNEKVMISYLDPHFMFSALFSDAFDDLTEEELDTFLALPPLVLEDLQTIVKVAMYPVNLDGLALNRPVQVFFTMLPDEEQD